MICSLRALQGIASTALAVVLGRRRPARAGSALPAARRDALRERRGAARRLLPRIHREAGLLRVRGRLRRHLSGHLGGRCPLHRRGGLRCARGRWRLRRRSDRAAPGAIERGEPPVPLTPAATVLLAAVMTQGEPGASSWAAPPETAQETEAPPAAGREAAAPGDALALGGTQIRDRALAIGAWGARRYGIGVLGGVLHASTASEVRAGVLGGKFVEVACDLSGGRTAPGLRVGEAVVGLTILVHAAPGSARGRRSGCWTRRLSSRDDRRVGGGNVGRRTPRVPRGHAPRPESRRVRGGARRAQCPLERRGALGRRPCRPRVQGGGDHRPARRAGRSGGARRPASRRCAIRGLALTPEGDEGDPGGAASWDALACRARRGLQLRGAARS